MIEKIQMTAFFLSVFVLFVDAIGPRGAKKEVIALGVCSALVFVVTSILNIWI